MPPMDDLSALTAEVIACRKCPRLAAWREEVAHAKRRAYRDWEYWGRPVPGFGDPQARVLVVGLAPGAHGSNRTGRMFTGDASGDFLYPALYRAGFISDVGTWVGPGSPDIGPGSPDVGPGSPDVGPGSPDPAPARGPVSRDDGLTLRDMYITAVCRCAPPDNKPLPAEMANCQPYLERELALLRPRIIVVLGRIAFDNILRLYSLPRAGYLFAHNAVFPLATNLPTTNLPTPNLPTTTPPTWLVCSYHPSQQNTLTGKLTAAMFDDLWKKVNELRAAL